MIPKIGLNTGKNELSKNVPIQVVDAAVGTVMKIHAGDPAAFGPAIQQVRPPRGLLAPAASGGGVRCVRVFGVQPRGRDSDNEQNDYVRVCKYHMN